MELKTVVYMTQNEDINTAVREISDKATRLVKKEKLMRNSIIEYNTDTWHEKDTWYCKLTLTYMPMI